MSSTHNHMATVLSQTNDLLLLLHNLLDRSAQNVQHCQVSAKTELATIYRELEVERLKHQETRQLLVDENQKLHLLDTQLYVLQRQLNREQSTFERAFGMLQVRDLNVTPEKMATQIAALQAACQEKEDELRHKGLIIEKLHKTLDSSKVSHKRELDDLQLEIEQKVYLTRKTANSRTRKNKT